MIAPVGDGLMARYHAHGPGLCDEGNLPEATQVEAFCGEARRVWAGGG